MSEQQYDRPARESLELAIKHEKEKDASFLLTDRRILVAEVFALQKELATFVSNFKQEMATPPERTVVGMDLGFGDKASMVIATQKPDGTLVVDDVREALPSGWLYMALEAEKAGDAAMAQLRRLVEAATKADKKVRSKQLELALAEPANNDKAFKRDLQNLVRVAQSNLERLIADDGNVWEGDPNEIPYDNEDQHYSEEATALWHAIKPFQGLL